ncbi:cytokine receptor family member b4 [Lampris incognitus]|uniref:cytokine receptor family member b4 n=1 Tax=Lampris incognitus TaxID=2546036 RepID=UPI0024B550CF|nr:cytokine receptor family member b4 [Lampris incognitus]
MPAVVLSLILTFSTLCGSRALGASGSLSGPRNVRITSYNMDLVLRWDPPENATGGVVYRTEYSTPASKYKVGCPNTTALSCHFPTLDFPLTVFGKYTFRVMAEQGGNRSVWVESPLFTMDEDTTIGPPSVSLIPNGGNLEVSIKDPEFKIFAIKETYSYVFYNITYWKAGQEEKAKNVDNLQQNRVVLTDLEPWTKYCVKVQIYTDRNKNPSQPSNGTCESTTSKEGAPWGAAVLTFIVMVMAVTLTAIVVVYRKKLFSFFCPRDSLPQHFKEYLLEPCQSPIYLAMQNSHPPEEIYHQVSVMENKAKGEALPLETSRTNCNAQPDATKEERLKGNGTVV